MLKTNICCCDLCKEETDERQFIQFEGNYICRNCRSMYDDDELREELEMKGERLNA